MVFEQRKEMIMERLKLQGTVTVNELMKMFKVADMTVRRDLEELQQQGLLKRVHGGAMLLEKEDVNSLFSSRKQLNYDKKVLIASNASRYLNGVQSIFLDGSTTSMVFSEKVNLPEHVIIFTDSVEILLHYRNRAKNTVIIIGGELAKDNNTVDGSLAVQHAEKLNVDLFVFSCRGMDMSGISNNVIGTQVKRIMLTKSKKKFLLADSTKFGVGGILNISSWKNIDILFTDPDLDKNFIEFLEAENVRVIF